MVRRITWRFSSSWMTYQETTSTSSSGQSNSLRRQLQWIGREIHHLHIMFPGCQTPTITDFFLVKVFISSTPPTASIGALRYVEMKYVMLNLEEKICGLLLCADVYWLLRKTKKDYCISCLTLCYLCPSESEHNSVVLYLELCKFSVGYICGILDHVYLCSEHICETSVTLLYHVYT